MNRRDRVAVAFGITALIGLILTGFSVSGIAAGEWASAIGGVLLGAGLAALLPCLRQKELLMVLAGLVILILIGLGYGFWKNDFGGLAVPCLMVFLALVLSAAALWLDRGGQNTPSP